jgi:hypothetical protein
LEALVGFALFLVRLGCLGGLSVMDEMDARLRAAGDEAMRRVGYLLLQWGQLETKIAYGIWLLTPESVREKMDPESIARTLTKMLKDWRAVHYHSPKGREKAHMALIDALRTEIEDAAELRNTMCHGMSAMVLSPTPPYARVACYEKYHHNRMVQGRMKQVFYDLPRLHEELVRMEDFISRIRDADHSAWAAKLEAEKKEAG